MKIKPIHSFLFILLLFGFISISAQDNRYLQIDISGGLSKPVQSFNSEHMFAGNGVGFSGGFDYFFNRIGLGISIGQFSNNSQDLFNTYLEHKYLEKVSLSGIENWNSKYVTFGPTLKIGGKKLEWDIYGKGGYSQIKVPDLLFTKTFFNQFYEVYHFSGSAASGQFAWSAGTRFTFKLNDWVGIQAKADYFTTSYLSKVNYDNTFRNASDGNRNGIIEDTEYFEAQKITNTGTSDLSVINLNMGLIFHLGKPKSEKITQMMPDEIEQLIIPVTDSDQIAVSEAAPAGKTLPSSVPDVMEKTKDSENPILGKKDGSISEKIETEPEIIDKKSINIDDIPIINANEAPQGEMADLVEIPATSYDAPESRYDEEAAEFLYKAGESYFATNDFENALPCFNKLKADPKYPRAKYMFALALSAMGNCYEAKKEYKEFAKKYKETDSRTLEIIFASHLERCATAGKLKNIKAKNEKANGTDLVSNLNTKEVAKEYKIQFIAMKKPDATFPKLAEVGNISTEFFPNMSVFRYTLDGYNDIKSAAADVYKVRKMGFRDAFVAVYENGIRINTLYHAK